jgi:Rnl2 family RNA ligase
MTLQSYPEIVLLPRRPEIFSVKEVVAYEKLHGSNFRIGFPLGMTSLDQVQYGSKEVEYDPTGVVKFPLPRAIEWFKSRPEVLSRMWGVLQSYGFNEVVVFGEIFGPGIHAKGVKYSNGTEALFRAFDIMVGENLVTDDLFCEVITKMGLPMAPEVWRGPPSIEAFDALLNKPSHVAKENGIDDETNLAEGVVIRSTPLLRNVFGDWLIVKHKAPKFSEVAHAPTEKKGRVESQADVFAATYVTPGRVSNAVGRLQDRGVELKNTMQDMPVLLQEILLDLQKECDWPEGMGPKEMTGSVSRVLGPILRAHLTK